MPACRVELPKPLQIQFTNLDPEQVTRRPRFQTFLTEQLAQLRDVDLERLLGRLRRLLLPERIDQAIARNDPVRLQQQNRQQDALLLPPKLDRLPVGKHLQRAQDSELQHPSGPSTDPLAAQAPAGPVPLTVAGSNCFAASVRRWSRRWL